MNRSNAFRARKIANTSLRQDNWVLRKNLKHLIQTTKRNMDIQNRIDELGEIILQCRDIVSLVETVAGELKERFGLNVVTVCLSEEFREIAGMIPLPDYQKTRNKGGGTATAAPARTTIGTILFFMDKERLRANFKGGIEPILRERLDYGSVDFFGIRHFKRVRSEAIIPLFHEERFLGSLNLGSNNPIRYKEGTATDYLKRFAWILSLALALQKMKLRDLPQLPEAMGE